MKATRPINALLLFSSLIASATTKGLQQGANPFDIGAGLVRAPQPPCPNGLASPTAATGAGFAASVWWTFGAGLAFAFCSFLLNNRRIANSILSLPFFSLAFEHAPKFR